MTVGCSGSIEQIFILRIEFTYIIDDVPAVISKSAVIIKGPFCVKTDAHYTATLYSLNASFREVFKSVEGFRCPMIRAQATWKFPAGNDFVYDPGITTERAGTTPLISTGS